MIDESMPQETGLPLMTFRDLIGRPDTIEIARLFHFDSGSETPSEELAALMTEYEDTVTAVKDHLKVISTHITKEGGKVTLGRNFDTLLHVSSLLLVGASARISECSTALSQTTPVTESPRITFKTARGIIFNVDGSPQEGITVVLESQDEGTDQLVCMKTNPTGHLSLTYELPDGNYMMTMLYADRVERQPIYIGQPKGGKPTGSAQKLA